MEITPTTTETVSGIFIDLADPKEEDIDIHDIAWALSRQARYAGHTMCKIPYTIAQHTVEVSRYVEEACTAGTARNGMLLRHLEASGVEASQVVKIYENVRPFSLHALMHDFAEAYLVDLPTPVKRLPGLYDIFKQFEDKFDRLIFKKFGLPYDEKSDLWALSNMVTKWADMHALSLEAHHFMRSRGLNWNLTMEKPSLSMIYNFRWPVANEQAYLELLERFNELKN